MGFNNAEECWKILLREQRPDLLREIEHFARENHAPAPVEFGTSGWRGEIGSDFTFHNLRIVTHAVVHTLKQQEPALRNALGTKDFDEVRRRGVVVGHDNRFLGPEFAREVMGMLSAERIKVYYCGETSTPQISAAIEILGAACAINLTPSHNPANYAGFKFNPADGGPAGEEITGIIQDVANRLMREQADIPSRAAAAEYRTVDSTELYIRYLQERGTLNLDAIRDFAGTGDCLIVVDHVHGSTRGRPERLLDGAGILGEKLVLLRTEDNYLFGGVAPEPSDKNMAQVEKLLKESSAQFRIGAIMDPDGDRIRFADHTVQIPMNYFGAMALHFLHVHRGIKGIVAKSVGTSNFVNAISEKHGIPVKETKVGFKNFRPYLLSGSPERAIVAFEESDGISGFNHTLEKDALFGLLLAIEMVAVTGKNLGEYLSDLMKEYGHYYPDRSGIAVDRSLAGPALKKKISVIQDKYPAGSRLPIGNRQLKIKNLITVDGVKMVLEDGSWLMIRPSGTEPKVRFYIEARTMEEKEAIFAAAARLTKEAIESR
ncbi:MAG: phosphomannomutase [bacterium]